MKTDTCLYQLILQRVLSGLTIVRAGSRHSQLISRLLRQHHERLRELVAELIRDGYDTTIEDIGVFKQVSLDLDGIDTEALDFHEVLFWMVL